jgi:hypothetical protein
LEVASLVFSVAGECDLRLLLLQLIENFAICDIANLVILVDHETLFVADTSFSFGHQSVTSLACGANIAVDALPALLTVTVLVLSRRSVCSIAQWLRTVVPSKARRT